MTPELKSLLAEYPGAETSKFGDNADLSARLIDLVVKGKKTATCGAARYFGEDGEAMPVVGRYDIALHWDGRPAVVIQTTDVRQTPFRDVKSDFALAEGENEDLEGWRRDHQEFFEREGYFEPKMMLICETFKVVDVIT